jgi:hypothetical protein
MNVFFQKLIGFSIADEDHQCGNQALKFYKHKHYFSLIDTNTRKALKKANIIFDLINYTSFHKQFH